MLPETLLRWCFIFCLAAGWQIRMTDARPRTELNSLNKRSEVQDVQLQDIMDAISQNLIAGEDPAITNSDQLEFTVQRTKQPELQDVDVTMNISDSGSEVILPENLFGNQDPSDPLEFLNGAKSTFNQDETNNTLTLGEGVDFKEEVHNLSLEIKIGFCVDLSDPTNGMINCSMPVFAIGVICRYTCNTGFKLNGSKVLACGDDGNWNGTAATCNGAPARKRSAGFKLKNLIQSAIENGIPGVEEKGIPGVEGKGIPGVEEKGDGDFLNKNPV